MINNYEIIFDPKIWPTAINKLSKKINPTQQQSRTQPQTNRTSNYSTPIQIPNLFPQADITQQLFQAQNALNVTPSEGVSKQEIAELLDQKISNLRIYVLESDITQAQNSVKSVVELASF